MELTDAVIQNLFGFASGLIGAVVGGLFTLFATDKAIRAENRKEDRQEEKEVENLLGALDVEVSTLITFHMKRVGAQVEALKPGDILAFYYPLTQDYFTVYNTNAQQLGKIRTPELREAIVICYNKCKKVVDGFKYNNELYRDWRDYADQHGHDNHVSGAKRTAMAEYARLMHEDHIELKSHVERMRKLIAAYTPHG